MCILFLARAHKTIIRGETKERKNEDFGNLLDKKSSVPDLAPIYLPFITSPSLFLTVVSSKWTLHLITYHYAFIGSSSPSKRLSRTLFFSFDNNVELNWDGSQYDCFSVSNHNDFFGEEI